MSDIYEVVRHLESQVVILFCSEQTTLSLTKLSLRGLTVGHETLANSIQDKDTLTNPLV